MSLNERAYVVVVEQTQLFPGVPMYGGSHKSPALTQLVKGDDQFTIGNVLNVRSVILCLISPVLYDTNG